MRTPPSRMQMDCKDPEHRLDRINGRRLTPEEAKQQIRRYGFVVCVRCQRWRDKLKAAQRRVRGRRPIGRATTPGH